MTSKKAVPARGENRPSMGILKRGPRYDEIREIGFHKRSLREPARAEGEEWIHPAGLR
jgi:hypothetical protein